MSVSFLWKHAGLLTLWSGRWSFHLFPFRPDCWHWGHSIEPCDMICEYWGLGPIGFVVTIPTSDEEETG